MPATPPTGVSPPEAPNRDIPAGFAAKMDAFLSWMVGFYAFLVASLANVFANATEAYNSAVAAASSAAAALASQIAAANSASVAGSASTAPMWASGNYNAGVYARSPSSLLAYIARTTGAKPTDPAADPINWALAAPAAMQLVLISTTSGAISVGQDALFTNAAASAGTAPASPAIGDEFAFEFGNGRLDNTIDFGTQNITGSNGVVRSGVVTWNLRGRRRLRFVGAANGGWRVTA